MSGGSYDYAYRRLEELADDISCRAAHSTTWQARAAFAVLLRACAHAARAIEWVDSDDCMPGDELAAIEAALNAAGRVPSDSDAERIRCATEVLAPELFAKSK